MADGELTLKIDAALAESLRARAEAAGRSVEAYAYELLAFGNTQGFEDSNAAWDEIDRIVDETDRRGGVPLEDVERWMKSWGTTKELPPPEARPRTRE